MNNYMMVFLALGLVSCGAPVVKDGDLKREIEAQGYSNVVLTQRTTCGKQGQSSKGKGFIGQRNGLNIIGQVCYWKSDGKVNYRVDALKLAPAKKEKAG